MQRRNFVGAATAVSGAGLILAPSIVRAQSAVRWRMPSSFPRGLDTLWGAADIISKRVLAMTDGKFEISTHSAGEIVPALGILDAVQSNSVECGHTAGFYYLGKEPALVFDTGVPFGLTPRQQHAWMNYGGGLELMREVYAKFNIIQFPAGNTGAQMGGWFRKKINNINDFKGLRIRSPGLVGQVYAKLGAIPQQIPGGEIYTSMEKGTIDAVEWVGPYDDEKLGLNKVAKFYYGPGVMELNASLSLLVNKQAWEALPVPYRAVLQSACSEASIDMLAKYDALNIPALKRIVGGGVQLSTWPTEVMRGMQKAADEVLDDNAAKNPLFAKILTNFKSFQKDQLLWHSINDTAAERFLQQKKS